MPCWSTALLPLRPTQDGAARVDTSTTLSPAQVPRHRILFVVPRVKIVKQTAILYTITTLKSKLARKNTDTVKIKLHSRKHKNGNANDNKNKRNEHDNIKMHKTPRRNAKNNNYVKLCSGALAVSPAVENGRRPRRAGRPSGDEVTNRWRRAGRPSGDDVTNRWRCAGRPSGDEVTNQVATCRGGRVK